LRDRASDVCVGMSRAMRLAMSDRQPNLENRTMTTLNNRCAALAVLAGLPWAAIASPALADVADFEFQLVQSEVKKGNGATVAVRLVNKKTRPTGAGRRDRGEAHRHGAGCDGGDDSAARVAAVN
jgi:hypothetical protein